jgi:biotin transport system substrate-specific component
MQNMTATTMILADRLFNRSRAMDVTLIGAGALVTALAAQIQIPMFPVPMTLQTLAVLLVGATLGLKRGSLSMSLYLLLGAIGFPVFAAAKTLTGVLPTAGYLVGFVFAAALVGWLASKGFSSSPLKVALSFALGSTVIYALGTVGLMITLGLSFSQALAAGVAPFILGDVAKAAAAAALLPLAWKFIK